MNLERVHFEPPERVQNEPSYIITDIIQIISREEELCKHG